MKNLITLTVIIITTINLGKAQTQIDASYFATNQPTYLWDLGGSPYLIMEDIKIPDGSDLIIEPDVEVLFQGHYKMEVFGSINAIGADNHRITFTSDDHIPWNGIRFDFSDNPNPASSKLHYCDISNSRKTGTVCTSPDPESSGGAIYVESFSDLEIYECEIFNNVVLAQGGAIGIYNNSSPKIWKSNIHRNTAVKRGGGICMMIDCDPVVTDNIFENNESTSKGGGAIGIGDLGTGHSCSPTIVGNKIYYNSATSSGGGIFICNADIANFSENTIQNNITQASGGGICIQKNSTVILESNDISDNTATANGGAVFIGINYNGSPDVTIKYCTINGNSADNGGGIYLSQSELDITYCSFSENTASTDGGGIYVLNSISTIENCTFEGNTATGNGGGVLLNNPKQQNPTDLSLINLSIFKTNTAFKGSALYIDRTTNYANNTKILNNLFVENHATDKGVVYMQGNNNNTIFNHNTVTNNTAAYFVSGVCVDYDGNFPDVINSQNFNNNIIYEAIVDVYITSTYQRPTNYTSTLIFINHLNTKYDQNSTPPYVPNVSPGFVSAADYHLSSSSACIDAGGIVGSATMTNTDLDGNQRIVNVKTDYGCYEYGSTPPARKSNPNSFSLNESIDVYPNPATDFLIIKSTNEQSLEIIIYSLSGQRVCFSESSLINGEKTISLSAFKPGAYIVKLQNESTILDKRIIIQ